MDRIYIAAMQLMPSMGIARLKSLIEHFGSARQAWQANKRDLLLSKIITQEICEKFQKSREKMDIEKLALNFENNAIKICILGDSEYPKLLSNIFDPRLLFYYRGTLTARNNIAIVGMRKATSYCRNIAQLFGRELASVDMCVVSGAARGIDTAAHIGALATGSTIAVLGCGINIAYPPENRKLSDKIACSGAVITEYHLGIKPHPAFFPVRNRIISGLACGTIEYALKEGRDVFAVPGSIFSPASTETHWLIKQGAKLIEKTEDVLEEYQFIISRKKPVILLGSDEQVVYNMLSYEKSVEIEEIILRTKFTASVVSYILLQLELRGLVCMEEG